MPNLGSGNLGFISRSVSGGPPFPGTSADNGLSVDTLTGRIVLGNDTGFNFAQLLSNREIPFNGFSLLYSDIAADLTFASGSMSMVDNFNFNNANVNVNSSQSRIGLFGTPGAGNEPPTIALDPDNGRSYAITSNGDVLGIGLDNGTGLNNGLEIAMGLSEFYVLGDKSLSFTGTQFSLNAGLGIAFLDLSNGGGALNATRYLEFNLSGAAPRARTYSFGDIDAQDNGLNFQMDDSTGTMAILNTAMNAKLSINGVGGFTGTVAIPTSITVDGGIVTNVT